jgi:hypothetical protein
VPRPVAPVARAPQLVRDALVHALELAVQSLLRGLRVLGALLRDQRAHRGERRLQAVREIVERVAITREAATLRVDQSVQIVGEPHELGRIPAR